MELWKPFREHFERRFQLGLRQVDPSVIRREKRRKHIGRAYSLIWIMVMTALVLLLFWVSRK